MNKDIKELLQKQLNGTITEEERHELTLMMESLSEEETRELHHDVWDVFTSEVKLSEFKTQQILSKIKHHSSRNLYLRIATIAATLLLIVGIAIYLYIPANDSRILAETRVVPYSQPTNYIRHITLKDGSTVILKAGSRLLTSSDARSVSLEGEAYFDIVHHSNNYFTIHTGHVTTTVLGTAFSISAKKDNVIVSVTRGRVKVDDGSRTLAILGVNDEICYRADHTFTTSQNINTIKKIETWTRDGMTFDHRTLADIARSISLRYGVNITITDSRLASEKVYVSFSGTESLKEVMKTLSCLLPNMKYNINGTMMIWR